MKFSFFLSSFINKGLYFLHNIAIFINSFLFLIENVFLLRYYAFLYLVWWNIPNGHIGIRKLFGFHKLLLLIELNMLVRVGLLLLRLLLERLVIDWAWLGVDLAILETIWLLWGSQVVLLFKCSDPGVVKHLDQGNSEGWFALQEFFH